MKDPRYDFEESHSKGIPGKPPSETRWLPAARAEHNALPAANEQVPIERVTQETSTRISLLSLLHKMMEMGASDLHLVGGNPPIFRINGDIVMSKMPALDTSNLDKILMPLLNDEYSQRFHEVGEIDFAIEVKNLARFRINYFLQHRGIGAVFRLIPITPIEIGSLGLPPVITSIAEFKKGLIIVTGPTGSGKTTTLAGMISHMNRHRSAHIITIEDPLEFVHGSSSCLITHREAGVHANSFADALKSALREDPNVILVGEMRDMETMDLALKAAEMGLLVLTTLHTTDAAKSVDRIIDSFPLKQQEQIRMVLSQTLKAVVAQQLVKRKDLAGRIPAVEVLIATKGLSSLIRDGKTHQISSIIQTGAEYGMQTMDQSFIELIKKDIIKKETIRNKISDIKLFERAGIFF
jgi:twitching motility protein PilT